MTNGQNDHHLYPSQKLAAKIAAKTLHADPAQAAIALRLDQLIDRLQTAALPRRKWPMVIRQMLDKILGSLFGRILPPAQAPVKGLYIHQHSFAAANPAIDIKPFEWRLRRQQNPAE